MVCAQKKQVRKRNFLTCLYLSVAHDAKLVRAKTGYASFLLHVLQRTRRRTTFPHFGQRAVDRDL